MIKLELSDQMVAVIGELLGNAPYKIASPIVDEMQKQINAQKSDAPKLKIVEPE